jgi:hypothetical protein
VHSLVHSSIHSFTLDSLPFRLLHFFV